MLQYVSRGTRLAWLEYRGIDLQPRGVGVSFCCPEPQISASSHFRLPLPTEFAHPANRPRQPGDRGSEFVLLICEEPPVYDPGNPTVDFHGEKRSNQTHASTTDPDALLARKGSGKVAKLSYSGHALMENRNGLVADVEVLQANGTAERDAALMMNEAIPGDHQVTVGADKNYDTKDS